MASKGPANRYGRTRGARQGKPTQNTNFAWARDFNKSTMPDHFGRHGAQVGAGSKEEYAAKAVTFANNIDRKNCLSFVDKNGSTYKFSKKTEEFVIVNSKGYVITYFKPKEGLKYYKKLKEASKK